MTNAAKAKGPRWQAQPLQMNLDDEGPYITGAAPQSKPPPLAQRLGRWYRRVVLRHKFHGRWRTCDSAAKLALVPTIGVRLGEIYRWPVGGGYVLEVETVYVKLTRLQIFLGPRSKIFRDKTYAVTGLRPRQIEPNTWYSFICPRLDRAPTWPGERGWRKERAR